MSHPCRGVHLVRYFHSTYFRFTLYISLLYPICLYTCTPTKVTKINQRKKPPHVLSGLQREKKAVSKVPNHTVHHQDNIIMTTWALISQSDILVLTLTIYFLGPPSPL